MGGGRYGAPRRSHDPVGPRLRAVGATGASRAGRWSGAGRGVSWCARASVLACVLLWGTGCRSDEPTGGAGGVITPEAFVEVYVELRRAALESGDSAAWEARKREILAAHGTTAEALEAFVDSHAHDVAGLARLWDTVAARLDPPDSAKVR